MNFPGRAEVPIRDWASKKMRSSYLLSWRSFWCLQNVAENFSRGSAEDRYVDHISLSPEIIASRARKAAALLPIKMLIFIDLLWFKAQEIIFWVYFSVHPGHKLWRSVHGPVLLLLEVAACSKALEREGALTFPGIPAWFLLHYLCSTGSK